MHAIHVVVHNGQQLEGRIIVWYSPGCGGEPIDSFGCGDINPVISDCEELTPTGTVRVWNPYAEEDTIDELDFSISGGFTGQFGTSCEDEHIFDCNGHAPFLLDGEMRMLVVGGGCGYANSEKHAFILDPELLASENGPWMLTEDMNRERWYPTATSLPDGRIIVFSGSESDGGCDEGVANTYLGFDMVDVPELYDPVTAQWTLLDCHPKELPYYPFMFVMPKDEWPPAIELFFAGPGGGGRYTFDLATASWSPVVSSDPMADGEHGSVVMYRPGKILKAGGTSSTDFCLVTNEAYRIDFDDFETGWRDVALMENARKDLNLVVMADGKVLAVGGFITQYCCTIPPCEPPNCGSCGSQVPGEAVCSVAEPVLQAELIDLSAANPQWTVMDAMERPHGYHSTAVLLPDARVLACGGENWFEPPDPEDPYSSKSAEIYTPPNLFRQDESGELANRPVIDAVSAENIRYGNAFTIDVSGETGDLEDAKVNLVGLGAVTHGFDENQRFVPLVEQPEDIEVVDGNTIEVMAPLNPTYAPPGYYMLFYISDSGVPSVARYIKLWAPLCTADFDANCVVNTLDLGVLLSQWCTQGACLGTGCDQQSCTCSECSADLNDDDHVDTLDLGILLAQWGLCLCPQPACTEQQSMMAGGSGGSGAMSSGAAFGSAASAGFPEVLVQLGWDDVGEFMEWFNSLGAAAQGDYVQIMLALLQES